MIDCGPSHNINVITMCHTFYLCCNETTVQITGRTEFLNNCERCYRGHLGVISVVHEASRHNYQFVEGTFLRPPGYVYICIGLRELWPRAFTYYTYGITARCSKDKYTSTARAKKEIEAIMSDYHTRPRKSLLAVSLRHVKHINIRRGSHDPTCMSKS